MILARKFLNSTIVVKYEIWAVQIKDSTIVKFMILGPALERFYNCRICGLSFLLFAEIITAEILWPGKVFRMSGSSDFSDNLSDSKYF